MTSLFRLSLLLISLLLLDSCASVIGVANDNNSIPENRSRRSTGSLIDDNFIETTINVNLNAADEGLKAAHISVVSYNGLVLLVGQVSTQGLKTLATQVATSSNSRVEIVHNELEVAGNTTFMARANDAWITAKVKTLMLANKDISGLKTKIITSNGVVYLMGLTTQREAGLIADLASHVRGVLKVVRAFEYI